MKVGLVASSISRNAGGVGPVIFGLAAEYAARAVEAEVFTLLDEHTLEDGGRLQVPYRAFRPAGPRGYGYAPGMAGELRRSGCTVIHAHGVWMHPTLAGFRAAKGAGVPFLLSPHGMLDPWALSQSRWKKRAAGLVFQDRVLRRASCLHALCESEYESMRAYGLKNPCAVIPNGVDLPQAAEAADPPWRGRVEDGRHVMLFLGRLHPKKGLALLVEAWALVKQRRPDLAKDWCAAIAGWSQAGHEEELRAAVARHGLERDILFLGPVFGGAKQSALACADAFVLPSQSEGLPVAVLEAWAHGLPVVMTPACNLPEGFGQGAAFEVRPSVESLTERLPAFFSLPPEARAGMGGAGRRLVEAEFSWGRVAGRMIRLYEWALSGGAAPEYVRFD